MKAVRKFSAAGPCIHQGTLLRETDKFYICQDQRFANAAVKKVAKVNTHVEPCPSCRDHAQTQYPNGYDN